MKARFSAGQNPKQVGPDAVIAQLLRPCWTGWKTSIIEREPFCKRQSGKDRDSICCAPSACRACQNFNSLVMYLHGIFYVLSDVERASFLYPDSFEVRAAIKHVTIDFLQCSRKCYLFNSTVLEDLISSQPVQACLTQHF